VLAVAIGLTVATLARVKKATLGKEPRHDSK